MRSQSLHRALAAVTEERELPVLVLAVPASPLIVVGRGVELDRRESERCRALRVPVLPWPGEGVRRLDRNRLLFQLIAAAATAAELGWEPNRSGAHRVAELAAGVCRRAGLSSARAQGGQVVAEAEVIGAVAVCALGARTVLIGDLATAAAGGGDSRPAIVAEELVSSFEEVLAARFEPSLPTPAELEAIYLNDEILAREELGGLGRPVAAGSGSV